MAAPSGTAQLLERRAQRRCGVGIQGMDRTWIAMVMEWAVNNEGIGTMRLMVGLIVMALAAPAAATDWYVVGVTDDALTFVDRDSIGPAGTEIEYWVYRIWHQPTASGMAQIKVRTRARCRDKSFLNLYMISYEPDGSNNAWTPERSHERHFAAPDSTAHTAISFACGEETTAFSTNGRNPEEVAAIARDNR